MQDRAPDNEKIEFRWNREVEEVLGDKGQRIRLRDMQTGEESTLAGQGMFVAIGHDPRSELFAGQLATGQRRLPHGRAAATRTGVDGVFAGGDVVDHTYRQAVTAAGTGCAAALDAERWLADHEILTSPAGDRP